MHPHHSLMYSILQFIFILDGENVLFPPPRQELLLSHMFISTKVICNHCTPVQDVHKEFVKASFEVFEPKNYHNGCHWHYLWALTCTLQLPSVLR